MGARGGMIDPPGKPMWDRLYRLATSQGGLFTTAQAADAGFSPQLLQKHLHSGRIARVQRAVYRLGDRPPGDDDELIAAWLWSEGDGVISHQTALALHGMCETPKEIHLTLSWSRYNRRHRAPPRVVLHRGMLNPGDCPLFGPVPVTSPSTTLLTCAGEQANVSTKVLRKALKEGLRLHILTPVVVAKVEAMLARRVG